MRKIKKIYHTHGWIFRFILIFLVTFWLSFFIFDSKTYSKGLNRIEENNQTYLVLRGDLDLSSEELSPGNLNSLFWELISENSWKDKICFKEKGSYIEYANRMDYESVHSFISYNGGAFFEIKGKKCFDVLPEATKLTFDWNFELELDFELDEFKKIYINETTYFKKYPGIVIHPEVDTYLKPNLFHESLRFIFLFIFSGIFIWTLTGIFNFIRYGSNKR